MSDSDRFSIHPDHALLVELIPEIRKYQELATKHGIFDIFQDNGGKLLQVLLLLGIRGLPGREGNDAVDDKGNEFELKSVNRFDMRGKRRSSPSFTTHHHLNPTILAKYRLVDWIFAVYSGIELEAVYLLTPTQLEPFYKRWEQKYHETGKELNNPKIPITFVENNAVRLYAIAQE